MKNSTNFTSEVLTVDEKKRFDRQLRLPNWNQDTLKRSTVLIAGIGGLGVEIAKNLAMVGVGRLILVDLDTIEYSNLNRQVLFVGATEGSSKAKIAADRIKTLNPFINVEAYHCALQDLPPILYHLADIYVAGLDSIEARTELNRRAVHFRKPLIDAGTAAYNGHVYCIFPFKNACLECDPLLEREQDELGACTLVGIPRKPGHCILKGQLYFEQEYDRPVDVFKKEEVQVVQTYANNLMREHFPTAKFFTTDQIIQTIDNHEPTVITINAVMASLQSQEVVKILHHIQTKEENKLGMLQPNYIIYNGLTGKFYEIEKPRNPTCSMCGSNRSPLVRIKLKKKNKLDNVIKKVTERLNLNYDTDFPPIVFKIDSSEVTEIEIDSSTTIKDAMIRNYETILITGFEDGKQIYVQIRIEDE
jgi:molybdopterin/thiamine biosynthesis adenylyltransferase